MFERITKFASMLSRRSDLMIALIMLTAVVMMIIPLPTIIVDIIITFNITLGLLILLVGFYITSPIQFSSLPAVILLSTVFRLAITITTTRLILLHADAGEVVRTFGEFVVGGNVAVGIVIFFIITIAQFVVITKGGERVAEVAARFSLDALPGKQMAIDNELRNGDITQAEARGLRRALERESHLYGAMDGALKFVKGDAIAGLVIILVNLIGGLAVGMAQQGLSFSDAAQTFSLLTVGDGLVSQIPALLVSLGAGTVVTRVRTDDKNDLGSDITFQLSRDARALYLASSILVGLSLIPGFPTLIFLTIAAGLGFGGYFVQKRNAAEAEELEEQASAEGAKELQPAADSRSQNQAEDKPSRSPLPGHGVVLRVGPKLGEALNAYGYAEEFEQACDELYGDLGVTAPSIDLRIEAAIPLNNLIIYLQDVPVVESEIRADGLLVMSDVDNLDLAEIPYEFSSPLLDEDDAIWVQAEYEERLREATIEFMTPPEILGRLLMKMLRHYASQFIGIQETRSMLEAAEQEFGDLVRETMNTIPIQKVAEIMRRLVEENVPIRNVRLILEALVEYAPREQDVILLGEYVRMSLARQISFRFADQNRIIAAYVLDRDIEDTLRAAIRPTAAGTFISIPEAMARPIVDQFRQALTVTKTEAKPVVLSTMDVRRHLYNLLKRNGIVLPVLSYQELTPEFSVQPLTKITNDMSGLAEHQPSAHVGSWEMPEAAH